MIHYDRGGWLSMVLRVNGSVLPEVWPRILATTTVSVVFTYLQQTGHFPWSLTVTPFLITGLPLGIILGFRNSSSYDRFWEGRKLWGALVNASRSLVRQLDTFVVPRRDEDAAAAAELRARSAHRLIAFVYALRMHLRGEKDRKELEGLLPREEIAKLDVELSPPAAILHGLGRELRTAGEREWLHARHAPILEGTLVSLTDVLGGCERIKNTPTPISYLIFIHRAVALYCFLLPFGVAETVRSLTPVVVFFVSYALFSLDAIGDELDDPFRTTKNALPIAKIARNIEIDVRRRMGEERIPEPIRPRDGILL
ncbi:MAG: bestrophin family protein [Labilithrix sp.]|nr:bestrophin family protein [Labilithrix sp.]